MRLTLFGLAGLALATTAAYAITTATVANSNAIRSERLRTHLEFIASDLLEGRDTPSRGLDLACEYVAAQIKLYGLKPAGENGTYYQALHFYSSQAVAEGSSMSYGGAKHAYGEGFYSLSGTGSASGDLVFVGFGWKVPGLNLDPYKDLDVKGKVLVTLPGNPPGFGFRERRGELGKNAWSPQQAAKELGAVGVVQLTMIDNGERFANSVQASLREGRPSLGGTPPGGVPSIAVDFATSSKIMAGGVDQGQSRPLEGSITFQTNRKDSDTIARNVLGMIEGSDPKLKSEYVMIGAHIDHIGMGNRGDGIFNGADDDGSGTVGILEIAHAFATGNKPKRSIVFIWHCGEEKGLLGSAHFVENPTIPLNNVVAMLNIDMIGRTRFPDDKNPRNDGLSAPQSIYIVGTTMMSTDLGKIAHDVNNKFLKLKYDPKYDSPNDPQRIFFRSDHYNYAKKGIPVLFWFDGEHQDYHGPDDEVDRIDFQKIEEVSRTVYATAWDLATRSSRPVVDKPLDR